jgi:hypothetical protein
MNRMLMLGAAMVLGLSTAGAANAQVLDCYGANGKVVSCAAGYGNDIASRGFYRATQRVSTRSTAPGEEEVTVTAVRPDYGISTDTIAPLHSSRPGTGGDWTPVVATGPIDQMQQWQQTFLTGDGLFSNVHF